jgi:hypothetical protein
MLHLYVDENSAHLRADLKRKHLQEMVRILACSLTKEEAMKIRSHRMLHPQAQDACERQRFYELPFIRVAKDKFRQEGLMLPFGQSRAEISVPNMLVSAVTP